MHHKFRLLAVTLLVSASLGVVTPSFGKGKDDRGINSKHRHKHTHGHVAHNHPHRMDHEGHSHDGTAPQAVSKPVPAPASGGWETVNVGSKRFSDTDRTAIKRYYRKSSHMLKLMAPPAPPPGTEKLVKRGAKVPPLIPIKSLPSRLKGKLSPAASGYKYGSIGAAVILYKKSSRAVADVYQVKPH